MSSEIDLKKDDLYDILKWWSKITTKDTIGDLTTMNRNQKLIIFKIGSSSYYINADTKKIGVNQFLLNKNNPWKIIFNENGVKNKVTNGLDENPISYFYMYKL
jgi:hypothetical protein